MGTYTTNYQLYMPTIGERGWGTLINGNYDAIDAAMKGLSNRITTVENEVNGALSCTSVTTSGTITSTGLIAANGGVNGGTITGTTITATNRFVGTLYGKIYVNGQYTTSGGIVTAASCPAQSVSSTDGKSNTITVGNYSYPSISYPIKVSSGVYIESASYVYGSLPAQVTTRTVTFKVYCNTSTGLYNACLVYLYVNGKVQYVQNIGGGTSYNAGQTIISQNYTVNVGDTIQVSMTNTSGSIITSATVNANPTYYIKAND